MPRNHRAREIEKIARAKRQQALERGELRGPSEARLPAAGVTSFPVKAEDRAIRALIDEALIKRGLA